MNDSEHILAAGGIHHITAVASSAAENLDFYTRILGLRLVKKTVNFDDPFTYHLYFGDAAGNPGTILTFFPWEQLPQGRPGTGMVTAIAFGIPQGSLDHWQGRLDDHRIAWRNTRRFGDIVLQFSDPHGLPLELISLSTPPASAVKWDQDANAIIGFHSATMQLDRLAPTRDVIAATMGMALEQQEGNRYRFSMGSGESPGQLLDVVVDPQAPRGKPGGGTVHHIAFRTRDRREQHNWQHHLRSHGLAVTGVRDRKYFESIYFNEPGGVLFEIATDPPGFAVDEPPDKLGSTLKLPSQYEAMRSDIERRLPTLERHDFRHVFLPPAAGAPADRTIVALHGTGGDENNLIPLARQISPGTSILSPRGKAVEAGMPRFFTRLAEGVFDQADVRRRAHELADFLKNATARYDRPSDGLIALGYSNGANIAASIMLLRPEIFAGAVLLRPMLPLETEKLPDLSGVPVLIIRGRFDAVIPAPSTDRLIDRLDQAGAVVTVEETQAGHEITAEDIRIAGAWLTELPSTVPSNQRTAVNQ